MRSIARAPLGDDTLAALAALSEVVAAANDPGRAAVDQWDRKPARPFAEIKDTLRRMAGGRDRCMYCEDSEGTDIEHFWPKRKYPAKAFSWENYLLACGHCNSNFKRDRFPLHGAEPALIDPTDPADDPARHLRLIPSSGRFDAIGPKGGPSIDVFDLNGDRSGRRLPEGRRDTLRKLQVLLIDYQEWLDLGDVAEAQETKATILREPFTAVLEYLVRLSRNAAADNLLRAGVAEIVRNHDVASWLTERAA